MNSTVPVAERIVGAINAHDLDAFVGCFADDVHNDAPAHPARSFDGSAQIRRNWMQIFAAVPDMHAELVRSATAGGFEWLELEFRGHRADGSPHLMRGVTINRVDGGQVSLIRFYMEPVDAAPDGIDAAVGRLVAGHQPTAPATARS